MSSSPPFPLPSTDNNNNNNNGNVKLSLSSSLLNNDKTSKTTTGKKSQKSKGDTRKQQQQQKGAGGDEEPLVPPIQPFSPQEISKFTALDLALRSIPELAREGASLLNPRALAKLVHGVKTFQDTHLGRASKYTSTQSWPITKLPDTIFRSRSPKGPLYTLLLTSYKVKKEHNWKAFDFVSMNRYNDNIMLLKHIERNLIKDGWLCRPVCYFDDNVSKKKVEEYTKIITKFGGIVVDEYSGALDASSPSLLPSSKKDGQAGGAVNDEANTSSKANAVEEDDTSAATSTASSSGRKKKRKRNSSIGKKKQQKVQKKEQLEEVKERPVVTHVIAWDDEEHDSEGTLKQEEESVTNENYNIVDKLYLRTITVIDPRKQKGRNNIVETNMLETKKKGGRLGGKGRKGKAPNDPDSNVLDINTPMAFVHWWYLPSSYDEFMLASDVDGDNDVPPKPDGGPWVVGCKFIRDVEKFNEWGLEADYAITDFEKKVTLYKELAKKREEENKRLEELAKKSERKKANRSPTLRLTLKSSSNKNANSGGVSPTVADRRHRNGMCPRHIFTGYYGGENARTKIRRLVYDGALFVPKEASTLLHGVIGKMTGMKPSMTYELPKVGSILRPSEDPELLSSYGRCSGDGGGGFFITELRHGESGTTIVNNRRCVAKPPPENSLIEPSPLLPRIRGGGDDDVCSKEEEQGGEKGKEEEKVLEESQEKEEIMDLESQSRDEGTTDIQNKEQKSQMDQTAKNQENENVNPSTEDDSMDVDKDEKEEVPTEGEKDGSNTNITTSQETSPPPNVEATKSDRSLINVPVPTDDKKTTNSDQITDNAPVPTDNTKTSESDQITDNAPVPTNDTKTTSSPTPLTAVETVEESKSSSKSEDSQSDQQKSPSLPIKVPEKTNAEECKEKKTDSTSSAVTPSSVKAIDRPEGVPSSSQTETKPETNSSSNNSSSNKTTAPTVVALTEKVTLKEEKDAKEPFINDQEPTTNTPSWYDSKGVSSLEKTLLPEWFDQSADHRTQESYITTREKMISVASRSAKYITGTAVRRSVAGDAGSLLRLHQFLVSWGFINGSAVGEKAPTEIIRKGGNLLSLDSTAPPRNKGEEKWSGDMMNTLAESVLSFASKKRKVDESSNEMVIDWEVVAKRIGRNVTPHDCYRKFLSTNFDTEKPAIMNNTEMQLDTTDDATQITVDNDQRGGKEDFVSQIVDGVSPSVAQAAIDSAFAATSGNISDTQKSGLLAAIATRSAERAREEEDAANHILQEILDQRMAKLENRLSLLDDLECMFDAERMALELERRDLYTLRCRHWFSGDS